MVWEYQKYGIFFLWKFKQNLKKIWLAAENIQKIHLFLFSKLAKVWLKDSRGMEERMKNKKHRSFKMFPSDMLKFKNIVKFN